MQLIAPVGLAFGVLICCVAGLLWRRRWRSALIPAVAAGFLYLFGATPLPAWLQAGLEKPYAGVKIADLPAAGAAPEWMSEKAISIGQYFVASGVYTVFGVSFPIVEDTEFHKLLFEGLEDMGYGKWGFTVDPYEMARMMIAHIDKKRKALGIDKARERVLFDMAARREMEAA